MLTAAAPIAFLATTSPERSRAFYRDTLGLSLLADEPFALVFDAAGVMLRIQKVQHLTPQPFTAFGWRVGAIEAVVAGLSERGVRFERYPGIGQAANGIWTAPDGARVAWFRDPDEAILSLTEWPAAQ